MCKECLQNASSITFAFFDQKINWITAKGSILKAPYVCDLFF